MLALALLALAMPAVNTWTVDDSGTADFVQISDAIDQALPGDVLLVEPGEYAAFALEKRLTILGRAGGARPHVDGLTRVIAESFTIAGLDFDGLHVTEAAGRGRIDDCRIGDTDLGLPYALEIYACAQIVVSRTRVEGSKAYSQSHLELGGSGMLVRTSNATLVECLLYGAKGKDPEPCSNPGGRGGTGLTVSDASRAVVVGSSIIGGPEGWGGCSLFSCFDGPSGTGMEVIGSTALVRGSLTGFEGVSAGWVDGMCTDTKGPDLYVAQGTLVISGVYFDPDNVLLSNGTLLEPAVDEPFITIKGTDVPGGHRDIRVHGPAGAACLLAVSPAAAYAPLGAFDDKLWVSFSGVYFLIPIATTGQGTPVVLTWTVPASTASLLGLSVELQPFFPGLPSALAPGKSVAGNVAELIVRF